MEKEILEKIKEQDKKLREIYNSVEKTRKYFLLTIVISAVAIIFPFIGLLFVIPKFLNNIAGGNLGL